jgi:hypothetical protein
MARLHDRSDTARTVRGLGFVAALAFTALAFQPSAAGQAAPSAMQQFLERPTIVHPYRGSRRLEASGGGRQGWLDVQTHFTTGSGLVYSVTAEGGSGYVRSRVLRSLLDEEQHLIARGASASVAISEANYQFTPEGINDEGLAVVTLRPRRKDRSLVAGRMFLNPVNADLVRLEGRLAKSPSFWITRTNVVRSYRTINGTVMPVSLHSTAQLRFFGSSQLLMTYRYSHIDEEPVDESAASGDADTAQDR